MIKFSIWFWSFVSGMGLVTSMTAFELGEPVLAFSNFGLTLLTTLVAIQYMEKLYLKQND